MICVQTPSYTILTLQSSVTTDNTTVANKDSSHHKAYMGIPGYRFSSKPLTDPAALKLPEADGFRPLNQARCLVNRFPSCEAGPEGSTSQPTCKSNRAWTAIHLKEGISHPDQSHATRRRRAI